MHKHSTLHTTFRKNQENLAVPSYHILSKLPTLNLADHDAHNQPNREILAALHQPQPVTATRRQYTPPNGRHPLG